ncbi:unnamed protein product [Enterobius vermicularis]|uniref:Thioredoxin-like_fold domain-containing protein n=1 Tax=Enterobius vermicularis TaxID=51028 RepID=A0A0N4VHN6_ENTVE|nr:unnamed protein product [Enterobius vermicularis]
MSFGGLYECAFKNAALKRFPSTKIERSNSVKGKNGDSDLVTLDQVMNRARYVVFYLISSSGGRANELIAALKRLQDIRNGECSDGNKTSPARIRRFFGVGHKSKKKKLLETREVDVIVVDVDPPNENQDYSGFVDSGWFTFVPMTPMNKSRLLRSLKYQFTPSVLVVDTATRHLVCGDGRRIIVEDPSGSNFPWVIPSAEQLFQGTVLKNSPEDSDSTKLIKIEYKDLPPSVKGLYFAANWCPPCRAFTKQLSATYKSLRDSGVSFEIFFCSSDRSEESFEHHFSTMPWLAFPFDHEKLNLLTRMYGVNGIPAFLILDEKNSVITWHGRNAVLGDPQGKFFPWGPQLMFELNEFTLCRLRDLPTLILFTEGTPEDVLFSIEVLRSSAEMLFAERNEALRRSPSKESTSQEEDGNEGSNSTSPDLTQSTNSVDSVSSAEVPAPSWADPLQVFYTAEDPICDFVLEVLKLGEAELPMAVIVDVIGGLMTVCQKPDVSSEIIEEFVTDYKNGRLEMTPLPASCQNSGMQIGGIPIKVVHQVLGIGNSPSQGSISGDKAVSPTAQNGGSSMVL